MRIWFRSSIAVLFVTALLSSPAVAQSVRASDPQSVVVALQDLGYRAQLETDSRGDPKIRSAADGSNFTIFFYGCVNNANCKYIYLNTGFNLTNGLSLESVNAWNEEKLWGRAYLDDENDPYLDLTVETTGGISKAAFEAVMGRWTTALSQFKKHIDW